MSTDSFFLIGGPCVIESREHTLEMAEQISQITQKLGIPYVFKASFDKANRTSLSSYRGPGLEEGLKILAEVKEKYNLPILTDVHAPDQCQKVAQVADILQIPAFLCRQTDLLVAAARTGRDLNIKKGQFCNSITMRHCYGKIIDTWKNENINQSKMQWDTNNLSPLHSLEYPGKKYLNPDLPVCLLTDRGNIFGSDDLVVDMRNLPLLRNIGEQALVVMDGTHSLQQPNRDGHTLGLRTLIPTITRAAVASGIDGLFMEVHDNPAQALSDKTTQWPLNRLEILLKELRELHQVSKGRTTNYLESGLI